MKGIILAGGSGNRLKPLTDVTNKHLLPIYDKPMIFHPLNTLLTAGIKDILIVTGPEYAGGFIRLLGSGANFNVRFAFEVQEEAGGIAQALGLASPFIGNDACAVILGDNIFKDDFTTPIQSFTTGAHIFLKEVPDPERFGVPELDGSTVINIEEKPEQPKSPYAVTGLYLYDNRVFEVIKTLKPSGRGELEITDVNNWYVQQGEMQSTVVDGPWTDAGTFESLFKANSVARDIIVKNQSKNGARKQESNADQQHRHQRIDRVRPSARV